MWFRNIFSAKRRSGSPGENRSNPRPRGETPAAAGALTPQAINLLNRLCLNTGQMLLSQPSGSRASTMRKPASDFREHRAYVPGDDVRYVDWKASARQEHVYVKQGEHEKAALVYILIDTSASMAWGDPPKTQTALSLAHALGYMTLAHGDRLMVLPVSDRDESAGGLPALGPLWGKGQAPQLSSYLQAIRFRGRIDLTHTLGSLSRRNLSSGGMVLVISDMFGISNLSESLDALPSPAWQVVFCHLLHPGEIDPGLNGHFNMVDIETGQKKLYTVTPKALETYSRRLENWRSELIQVCRDRKAVYSMLPTSWSVENEILPQLRRDRVVKPL